MPFKTTDINNLQNSLTKQKILHLAKNKNTFENVKTLSWAIPHTDLRMKQYRDKTTSIFQNCHWQNPR